MPLFTYRNSGATPRRVVIEPWAWAGDLAPRQRVHIEFEFLPDWDNTLEVSDEDDGSLWIAAYVSVTEIRDDDQVYLTFRDPTSLP